MEIFEILLALSAKMGYWGIIFLMAIESSFVPLPSELIIPPAAYLASKGQMNIFLIILCGTFGSLLGALFNYYLAFFLGRKIVYAFIRSKYAKIFLLSEKHIIHAEKFFIDHGNISTFIGRLLPGVRHLISIPAGFARMNLFNFMLYTVLGAFIWTSVLAALGYYLGTKQDLIMSYAGDFSKIVLVLALLASIYWLMRKKKIIQK